MRKGFELLKTREASTEINFEELEKVYNLEIPLLYKIFINNFSTNEGSISYDVFYHPEYKDNRYLSYYSFLPKPEIDFTGFNSIENAILFSKEIEEKDDIDYLTIGYCSIGGILLGLKGNKKDKIFYYDPDGYPETHIEIADNIFDFIKGLSEVLQPESDMSGVKYSDLYKKWGEDFWRVKD